MPKNKIPGFWDIHRTIKKTAKERNLDLSSKEIFNISNHYVDVIEADEELQDAHDPKTYSDPTGEEAVRKWFIAWVNSDAQGAAA